MSANKLQEVLEQVSSVVLGKEDKVKLALSCILAEGHLLIEDLPGMGKPPWRRHLVKALVWIINEFSLLATCFQPTF
jgi:MoxR-like ATPase